MHSHAEACAAVPCALQATAVRAVSPVVRAREHGAAVASPLRGFWDVADSAPVGWSFCAVVAVAGLAFDAESDPPASNYRV